MVKVLITGLGCVSALGLDVQAYWRSLLAGRCGIARYAPAGGAPHFPLSARVAAQVSDFDPERVLGAALADRLDRFAQLGLLASREAVADAGFPADARLGPRCAVILGSGIGGIETMDEGFQRLYVHQVHRLQPLTIPKVMLNAAVSAVSMAHGATGPCFAIASACSSANHALAQAYALVRAGVVDLAIAGGSEACLIPGLMKSWEALRILDAETCRPFSRDRRGLVLGEGAGVLVLESDASAARRGARVHGELAGCGLTADAADLVLPSGEGAVQAMAAALRSADLAPEQIGYINAHGTGTPSNDLTETEAIHRCFGSHARRLAISSTKSMHGHTLGAAGGVEAVATVLALREGVLPPTVNYREPDPGCDLDYVPNAARAQVVEAALSNSFGFGGLNAVLAFRRV